MAEHELIQRQREILRTFRKVTAAYMKAETDTEDRCKVDCTATVAEFDATRWTATTTLEETTKFLESVRRILTWVGLGDLLTRTYPNPADSFESDDTPFVSFTQNSSVAWQNYHNIVRYCNVNYSLGDER